MNELAKESTNLMFGSSFTILFLNQSRTITRSVAVQIETRRMLHAFCITIMVIISGSSKCLVIYYENDVDCRHFLQLVHFGEKFNSFNCGKTCDNCLNSQTLVDKDVTDITKQLVDLVKSVRQQFSTTHILDVYRGSMSQIVKRNMRDKLCMHGSGKHLAKGEAS